MERYMKVEVNKKNKGERGKEEEKKQRNARLAYVGIYSYQTSELFFLTKLDFVKTAHRPCSKVTNLDT